MFLPQPATRVTTTTSAATPISTVTWRATAGRATENGCGREMSPQARPRCRVPAPPPPPPLRTRAQQQQLLTSSLFSTFLSPATITASDEGGWEDTNHGRAAWHVPLAFHARGVAGAPQGADGLRGGHDGAVSWSTAECNGGMGRGSGAQRARCTQGWRRHGEA